MVHAYPDTEQEGKEQLVFLKEGAAHVAVEAEGEVFVDVFSTLGHVICGAKNRLESGVNWKNP